MLGAQFARARFIEDSDPQERCRLLAAALTKRLEDAANSHQCMEWIIADLRALEHEVTLWDQVLSDAWSKPQNDQYLWIVLDAGSGAHDNEREDSNDARWVSASVAFRPRLRDLPRRCPQCFGEMAPRNIRLRIQGHGSAVAPALRVRFESPGLADVDALIGAQSLEGVRLHSSGGGLRPEVRPVCPFHTSSDPVRERSAETIEERARDPVPASYHATPTRSLAHDHRSTGSTARRRLRRCS